MKTKHRKQWVPHSDIGLRATVKIIKRYGGRIMTQADSLREAAEAKVVANSTARLDKLRAACVADLNRP